MVRHSNHWIRAIGSSHLLYLKYKNNNVLSWLLLSESQFLWVWNRSTLLACYFQGFFFGLLRDLKVIKLIFPFQLRDPSFQDVQPKIPSCKSTLKIQSFRWSWYEPWCHNWSQIFWERWSEYLEAFECMFSSLQWPFYRIFHSRMHCHFQEFQILWRSLNSLELIFCS